MRSNFFGRRHALSAGIIAIWAGVVAPVVYGIVVIAGAGFTVGYSQFADPISALTETGRANALWINIGFLTYNLLLAAFAMWGVRTFRAQRLWRAAFLLLLLTALSGMLMWPFAQDPVGTPASFAGIVHIALAAVEALSSVAVAAIAVFACRSEGHWRLAMFSAACLILIVLSGIAAALATAGYLPLMGLFERVTIGTFEVWIGVFALSYALGSLAVDTSRL